MILFLPTNSNSGGFSQLGEKVIKVWVSSVVTGLVSTFIGKITDLSETVQCIMLGTPLLVGIIVSIYMLSKDDKKEKRNEQRDKELFPSFLGPNKLIKLALDCGLSVKK